MANEQTNTAATTSKNSSLNLMGGRLGLYGKNINIQYVEGDGVADKVEETISGLTNQNMILKRFGGIKQQDRMIKDKRRSLDKALLYSYQAATIKKVTKGNDSEEDGFTSISDEPKKIIRALINPNKLKMDYDEKIVSVGYEQGFKCGDIFEWEGTNTYWLIYLQELTELAYFRGDIRKCTYVLRWVDDEDIVHETYAGVRGPVETKINFIQKNGISIDEPNHSLNIILPKTEETVAYFKRYAKFYITRIDDPLHQFICWRVEGFDDISTPGILEITAVEYYVDNDVDNVMEGIAGGRLQTPYNPNKQNIEILIEGETFIKPRKEYTYKYKGLKNSAWLVDKKYPVEWSIDPEDETIIKVKWTSGYSGQFEIIYGNFTKTIVVESLF